MKDDQTNDETPQSVDPQEPNNNPVTTEPEGLETVPEGSGVEGSGTGPRSVTPDKAAENWEKFLRTAADFENYKKRVAKERSEAAKYGQAFLLQRLIPVLDNFEMAVAAAEQGTGDKVKSLKEGVAMILQQLKTTLAEAGLSELEAQGQPFDPNWHEAVLEEPSEAVAEGHVIKQLRKGYKLHDRLLRPASVVVSKGPTSSTLDTSTSAST